jgi:hypothetical protein
MSEEERRRQEYALQKLYLAISDLVGTGDVRERLINVYISHLSPLSPRDFPEELRGKYRDIYEALTWLPPDPGQGKLQSTINRMSVDEAVLLAQRLVALFWDLEQLHSE